MAMIMNRTTGETISDPEGVRSFIAKRGLLYEKWGVERLNGRLKEEYALSPEEQSDLLNLYREEIERLKTTEGYRSADIVVLSPKTPNLQALLDKFVKEHHHTDGEVRFVIDGSGIFTIHQGNEIYDIVVRAGDLLVVPAYTRHWFDLTEEKKIKCVRIFKDPAGWEAVY